MAYNHGSNMKYLFLDYMYIKIVVISGPILSAITLTLILQVSRTVYIDFKGRVQLKWSGEYESWLILVKF